MASDGRDGDTNESKVIKIVGDLLHLQLEFAVDGDVIPQKAMDDYSIGYVVGFVTPFLDRLKIDNEGAAFGVITCVFMALFGQEAGPDLAGRFLNVQQTKPAYDGQMRGGNDAIAWLRDQQKMPGGWFEHIKA